MAEVVPEIAQRIDLTALVGPETVLAALGMDPVEQVDQVALGTAEEIVLRTGLVVPVDRMVVARVCVLGMGWVSLRMAEVVPEIAQRIDLTALVGPETVLVGPCMGPVVLAALVGPETVLVDQVALGTGPVVPETALAGPRKAPLGGWAAAPLVAQGTVQGIAPDSALNSVQGIALGIALDSGLGTGLDSGLGYKLVRCLVAGTDLVIDWIHLNLWGYWGRSLLPFLRWDCILTTYSCTGLL